MRLRNKAILMNVAIIAILIYKYYQGIALHYLVIAGVICFVAANVGLLISLKRQKVHQ